MSCGPASCGLLVGVGGIILSGSVSSVDLGLGSDAGVNVGDGEGIVLARLELGSSDLTFMSMSPSGLGKPRTGLLLLLLEGGRDLSDMMDGTCKT